MITRILLDMDEVITDFTGGACRVHGWTRQELEAERSPGEWDITKPMGITQDEFWAPINAAGSDFWFGLQPLPWIYDVLHMMDSLTDKWFILSSPAWGSASYIGKVLWLKRFFGHKFDRFCITPHKYLLAKEGALLIDDSPHNVETFRSAGGRALLFPSRGNDLYRWADDPVPALEAIIKGGFAPVPRKEPYHALDLS